MTSRIEKDPLFYTVDEHFSDDLIFDIDSRARKIKDDSTFGGETITNEEIERDKRRMRRMNQAALIRMIRAQDLELRQIRKDLKPVLMLSAFGSWFFNDVIRAVVTVGAIALITAWLSGLFTQGEHHEAPVDKSDPVESRSDDELQPRQD